MALVEAIDFIIGISDKVPERAAISFSVSFYQALAFRRSVREAFELATNGLALESTEFIVSPVLLVRKGVDQSVPLISAMEESPQTEDVTNDSVAVVGDMAGQIMIAPPEPWPHKGKRKE